MPQKSTSVATQITQHESVIPNHSLALKVKENDVPNLKVGKEKSLKKKIYLSNCSEKCTCMQPEWIQLEKGTWDIKGREKSKENQWPLAGSEHIALEIVASIDGWWMIDLW